MAEAGIIFLAEQAAEILSPFLKEGGEKVIEFFTTHPEMQQPANSNDAFVLDKESYINYGWDVIEEV